MTVPFGVKREDARYRVIWLPSGSDNQFDADRSARMNGSIGAIYGLLAVGYSPSTEMDSILPTQPHNLIFGVEIGRPEAGDEDPDSDQQAYKREGSCAPPVSGGVHYPLFPFHNRNSMSFQRTIVCPLCVDNSIKGLVGIRSLTSYSSIYMLFLLRWEHTQGKMRDVGFFEKCL